MSPSRDQVLERIGSAGVLLDLVSGNVFALNEAATLIWEQFIAGATVQAIAVHLANAYGLSEPAALLDVREALRVSVPIEAAVANEYQYERSAGGYVFRRQYEPLLAIDPARGVIQSSKAGASRQELLEALWAVAPKLLALQGDAILHAAAVAVGGGVLAFSGESGAGKTTSAQAFVSAGGDLVCEDKLLIDFVGGRPGCRVGLEDHVRRWARAAADALATGHSTEMIRPMVRAEAEWAPVREIGFIDQNRRAGESIAAVRLTPADAASRVFCNAFQGSDDPAIWRSLLQISVAVASETRAYKLTMPSGTSALQTAAASVMQDKGHPSLEGQMRTIAS